MNFVKKHFEIIALISVLLLTIPCFLFGGEPTEEFLEVRGPSESPTYCFWWDIPEEFLACEGNVHAAIAKDQLKVAKIAAILDRDVHKTIVRDCQGSTTKYYLAISETISLDRRDLEFLAFQCDVPNFRTGHFDCVANTREIELTLQRAERILWNQGPEVMDLPDFLRVRQRKPLKEFVGSK